MKMNMTCILVVASGLFVGPWTARAQFSLDGVSGTGNSIVKKTPQVLRLQIDLTGKDKDMKRALAKLKTRQETAKAALLKMGVTESSIKFGDFKIVPEKNDQQRRMEMMVQQRIRGGGAKATTREAEKASPVTVAVTLKAEWALQGDSAEARLVSADEIQKKVKAADLGGLKESQQLSAEEREVVEENEGNEAQVFEGGEQGPKAGEPIFLYVSKISPEERAKALVDAFTKARTEAEELGKAAGVTLGTLRSVASTRNMSSELEEMSGYGGFYQRMAYSMMQRSEHGESEAEDEAIGTQPGSVSLRFSVNLTYALK